MHTKPLLTDSWGGSHWCPQLPQKGELPALTMSPGWGQPPLQPLPNQPEHRIQTWLNIVSCISQLCWDSGFEELCGLHVWVPNNFRLILPWDYFGAIAGRANIWCNNQTGL